jgi:hypothetical protein
MKLDGAGAYELRTAVLARENEQLTRDLGGALAQIMTLQQDRTPTSEEH